MPPTSKQLRTRREERGLSLDAMAERLEILVGEYFELEFHPDEAAAVVELKSWKKLASLLGLDLLALFDVRCAYCGGSAPAEELAPRPQLVRERRVLFGLTQDELAARVDAGGHELRAVESDENALESWPIERVLEFAQVLGLPAQRLLDVKCPRCGQ